MTTHIITERPQGAARAAIAVQGVTKRFQGFAALRDVSIDFLPGQVHVLFGENGAGKSTLIGVLAGIHRPDEGTILLDGQQVQAATPRRARELGIAAVFQEPALVPQLTVAENLALGREPTSRGLVDRRAGRRQAVEALARIGSSIPPDAYARDLSRAEQQILEIARALQGEAKVLILDEPTASLTDNETDCLFDVVHTLRREGLAIIYITHRMGEIRRIGDRVSVLRDGALIRTCPLGEVTDDDLVTLMTGRQVGALFPEIPHRPGGMALELQKVSGAGVLEIDLQVRQGEVVGLTGLVGSGKAEIGQLCFGLARTVSGRIRINGQDLGHSSPSKRLRQGMVYYPADRKHDGLVASRPARENVSLPALDRWTRAGFLDRRRERLETEAVLKRLSLRPANPDALPPTFSGGNQQKIVLGRGFTRPYGIHIFDEPTAGVDVGARAEIYEAIKELADSGAAVLLISSDLPEVINLVHRAYVVAEGRIAGEFSGEDLTEETLLPVFFTQHEKEQGA
ncbi:sugar ABC transporter ATP-binding protein [Arthrobacter sp. I2-34]|uniref:Sugar ABC transporter ATP-binding protein n=1 Tax=Arthrobacter hankyongi TaxID=2904801 RepID=A0ABS9LDM9_9MICC|nr:sugar ABC transporter ATP-binding protein [Arthrobacter hankyongi]MCG2624796.1 sugar ABC transporter ATP-binding protein [Arthrobacter hankyongi]